METCDSSVFLANAPFQPKVVPAAKETNKSSTPNMDPIPAELKAINTKIAKNDSRSIKFLVSANSTSFLKT